MISPRVRRLKLDYETLTQRLAGWPLIQISGTAGMPPEVYRFTYHVKGLYVSPGGEILERAIHEMEVSLLLGYPRRAPQCRMLTPIFHPNFDDATVCIGDFWAASEGLDDLVMRVARMIAYQEYNVKSPLNGFAAKWAAEHPSLLPVDERVLTPPHSREEKAVEAAGGQPGIDAAPATEVPVPQAPGPPRIESDPWEQKIVIRDHT